MSDGPTGNIAMKSSTLLVTAAAVLSAVLSAAVQAQTGRPSTIEVKAAADAPRASSADAELGSYGRYLMLNGATREDAIAASRNIDRPAARKVVADRSHAPARE